jgi:hypothetical protein
MRSFGYTRFSLERTVTTLFALVRNTNGARLMDLCGSADHGPLTDVDDGVLAYPQRIGQW